MPTQLPTITPSLRPTTFPSEQLTLSRFTALRNVIDSYYLDRPFSFVIASNQYNALSLLANSDPLLVPVPDDSNSEYLLLQQYALMLLYLNTNGDMWTSGKWLNVAAGDTTCDWSGVSCIGGSIGELSRTYNTVKTEPVAT
jgi:hypothetical protein